MTDSARPDAVSHTPVEAGASDPVTKTPGVLWSAWPEDDCDSDARIDPMAQKVTEWFVGRWPVGTDEPECRILVGEGRSAEIVARRIAAKLTSILNTDAISAALAPSAGPVPDEVRRAFADAEQHAQRYKDGIAEGDLSDSDLRKLRYEAAWAVERRIDAVDRFIRNLLATPSGRPDTPPAGGGAVDGPWSDLLEAARPFAGGVFHDNGDVTLNTGHIGVREWVRLSRAVRALNAAPEPAAGGERKQCERCQGNGEIVADWDAYLGEGQPMTDAVEECPDCSGVGSILSAPSEAETAGGDDWQPIETAPKEQQPILLALDSGRFGDIRRAPAVAFWSPKNQAWRYWYGEDFDIPAKPTHWRPLPAPPTPATSSTPAEGK